AASLLIGLFGGFALALLLSIDAAEGFSLGTRWPATAQAHGHLQLIGFAGLFVAGMALRLAPRFAGHPLAFPHLVPLILVLLAGGVIMRGLSQPLADNDFMALALVAAVVFEVAGAAFFAICILPTVYHAALTGQPAALYFALGSLWLIIQATLGAWWLTELANDGELVLAGDRDRLLVGLQLFGFVLSFVSGVILRALPTFFRFRTPSQLSLLPFALLQAGVILFTLAGMTEVLGDDRPEIVESISYIAISAGLLVTALLTGFWRPAEGLRPAARSMAIPLRAAMGWLVVAAVYLAVVASRALVEGENITFPQLDSTRHILALGVVFMLIVGMANLVVPDMALQRMTGRQTFWRGVGFSLALSLVVVLRTGDELLGGVLAADDRFRHWAYAAAIAIAVLLVFAWLLIHAAREQPMTLTQVSKAAPGE
ncbi:MAG TPA: hypothetical protein VFZ12_06410, partial [Dehalococcoidia bacterium]|nr:hypothetical protein [Dehalococcoidia bacterium]